MEFSPGQSVDPFARLFPGDRQPAHAVENGIFVPAEVCDWNGQAQTRQAAHERGKGDVGFEAR